jgi:hypothetical protein
MIGKKVQQAPSMLETSMNKQAARHHKKGKKKKERAHDQAARFDKKLDEFLKKTLASEQGRRMMNHARTQSSLQASREGSYRAPVDNDEDDEPSVVEGPAPERDDSAAFDAMSMGGAATHRSRFSEAAPSAPETPRGETPANGNDTGVQEVPAAGASSGKGATGAKGAEAPRQCDNPVCRNTGCAVM